MVIVGGTGTLIGPILGAAFFLTVEHQLSNHIEAWALFFGLIFIGFVIFAPEGIWGLIRGRRGRSAELEFPVALPSSMS
jgi:branched-chain amino acid transport system permease protein